jgi:hypothetical protein
MSALDNAWLISLIFVGIALFTRFLLVGLRGRDTITLFIAFSTLVGCLAVAFFGLAFAAMPAHPVLSRWFGAASVASATLCVSSNVAMTAVMFHGGSRFGWFVSGFFLAAMWSTVAGVLSDGGVDVSRRPSGWLMANAIMLLGTLFWGSLEAAVTWRFLRRQVNVGLASEGVVRRVGFFSVASGLTALAGTAAGATLWLGMWFRGRTVGIGLGVVCLFAGYALFRSFGTPQRAPGPPARNGGAGSA